MFFSESLCNLREIYQTIYVGIFPKITRSFLVRQIHPKMLNDKYEESFCNQFQLSSWFPSFSHTHGITSDQRTARKAVSNSTGTGTGWELGAGGGKPSQRQLPLPKPLQKSPIWLNHNF